MLTKQIIINSGLREKRAGILVDNELDEILLETDTYDQIASNIYRGRVKDVLAGMQAAFVDIGTEKNAFLHISDVYPLLNNKQKDKWNKKQLSIKHVLQPGQEIMVQVVKEAIGSKGPKVTCKISVPGRYFVLLPYEKRIGISRRIEDKDKRNHLKNIARDFTDNKYGVIVRTNAEGKQKEVLANDYHYLANIWSTIQDRYFNSRAPALVYKHVEMIKLIVRDYLSPEINKVVVDDRDVYHKLLEMTKKIVPHLKNRIFHYKKETPIFENYGIEKEMEKIFRRKVWLDSGGYIIIDSTEALVSIDVNTGKYIGEDNLQETVFQTNLEAAREIARQLKLRDLGGIIIIDFIDMTKNKHQNQVIDALEDELSNDRTKTAVLGLTQLGLVEMTRQKVRDDLGDLVQKDCPYCEGTGQVMSEKSMALEVIRRLRKMTMEEDFSAILLELHPRVAAVLIGSGGDKLEELEKKLAIEIYINGNKELHIEEFNILEKGTREKLRKRALPVNAGQKINVKIEESHINNEDDGIARIKGYIIIIKNAGHLVNEKADVRINEVSRTYARAELAH